MAESDVELWKSILTHLGSEIPGYDATKDAQDFASSFHEGRIDKIILTYFEYRGFCPKSMLASLKKKHEEGLNVPKQDYTITVGTESTTYTNQDTFEGDMQMLCRIFARLRGNATYIGKKYKGNMKSYINALISKYAIMNRVGGKGPDVVTMYRIAAVFPYSVAQHYFADEGMIIVSPADVGMPNSGLGRVVVSTFLPHLLDHDTMKSNGKIHCLLWLVSYLQDMKINAKGKKTEPKNLLAYYRAAFLSEATLETGKKECMIRLAVCNSEMQFDDDLLRAADDAADAVKNIDSSIYGDLISL